MLFEQGATDDSTSHQLIAKIAKVVADKHETYHEVSHPIFTCICTVWLRV